MTLDTDPGPGATAPPLPELPDGWHYTDDVAWDDPTPWYRRRMLVLGVAIVALVVAVAAGLVVWSAAAHYARGVTALKARSYTAALSEFSSARLVVVPYRDSMELADQARYRLAVEAAGEEKAVARVHSVTDAIDKAAAALESGTANGVVVALSALPEGDLKAAVRDSGAVRTAASSLAESLTTAAERALGHHEWGAAGRYAGALLVVEPSSRSAEALAAKAQTGQELASRLAQAEDAARSGQWRSALRLALAVTAVKKDFPGAASLVAKARKALAPKPKAKPSAGTTAPATTTTAPSTGGPSSGSTPQPPPP